MTKQVTKKDSPGTGDVSAERLTKVLDHLEVSLLSLSIMLEQAKTMLINVKATRQLIERELGMEPSEE